MHYLVALILLLLTASNSEAATYYIDLTDPGGIPGTSGIIAGPCYCGPAGPLSSIYLFQAGDVVDFGNVTIYPVEALNRTTPPPGSPPPPRIFLSSGVGVSFNSFAPYPDFTVTQCLPGEVCTPPSTSVHLLYTIPTGADRIQLGWFGSYSYTPPELASAVPEPATWTLMILGFAGVGCVAARKRKPRTASQAS